MYLIKTIHSKMLQLSKTVWTGIATFMIVLAAFGLLATYSGYAAASEYEKAPKELIKAGYLYKFIFFVQWPENKQAEAVQDDKITIGILGKDPFGDYLKPIEGRVIKSLNKKVAVKRFGPYRPGINLKQCQVLYICPSEERNIKWILKRTKGTAVLTVADTKGFLEYGGMVKLVDINGLLRWEINLPAIKRSGLTVSSTLLQSAVRVIKAP